MLDIVDEAIGNVTKSLQKAGQVWFFNFIEIIIL